MSAVDGGLVAGMTLGGTASARRLKLSSFSSSVCGVARWSPRFSTTPPTRLIAAASTNPKVTLQKLRSANSSGQPWLVLPPQTYENPPPQKHGHGGGVTDYDNHLRLFDIENGTVVPIPMPRPLPEGEELNWRWIGSSQGWLILGHEKAHLLCLFNPMDALREDSTKPSSNRIIRISLPDTYPRRLPQRVLLTSPPPSSSSSHGAAECQVIVAYSMFITFCSLNAADSNSSPPWKLLTTRKNRKLLRTTKTEKYGATRKYGANSPYVGVFLEGGWLVTLSWKAFLGIPYGSHLREEFYVEYWDLDHYSCPDICFSDFCNPEEALVKSQLVLSHEKSAPLLRRMYLVRWSPPEHKDENDHLDMLLVIRYVFNKDRKKNDNSNFEEEEDEDDSSDFEEEEEGDDSSDFDFEVEEEDDGFRPDNHFKTVAFDVYRSRSNCASKPTHWDRVESLGDRASFLDLNQSLAVPVPMCEGSTIKSNCIYFTDSDLYYKDHYLIHADLYHKESCQVSHDCGVFDMADQTIHSLDFDCGPPMWLFPSLQP